MTGTESRHAHHVGPAVPADRRSDAELVAGVRQSGDEAALGELYRRHRPAVLAYARTFARDPHTAEDLASEAFTRTLHAVRSGAGPDAAWRPYLLTVVRHTAGQWAVSARRTELSEDFEQWLDERAAADPASGGAECVGVEERIVALEDLSFVVRGFRALPERWQAALWHSVVEGESAERIGVLLGVSPSGVTSLTARAREGLREAYLGAHAESGSRSEECRRHGPLLAAAVRRPGSRTSRQLRRHLDACDRCRHVLFELTDLDQRLRALLPAALLLWGVHAYLAAQRGAAGASAGAAGGSALGAGGGGTASAAPAAGTKLALLGAGAATAAVLVVGGLLLPVLDGDGGEVPVSVPAPTGVGARSPEAALRPPTPTADEPSLRAGSSPSASAEPSAPEWSPRAEDRTRLRLAATGRCMEIPAGSRAVGVQAREAPCDGARHQVWDLLRPGDGGQVQIRNAGTGRCLANQGTEIDDAPVVQVGCDPDDPRQLWGLYAQKGSGEARFIQRGDRMYLGLNDWAKAADGRQHTTDIGTNHHYYGSSSFGFRYDGALFDGRLAGGPTDGASAPE